MGTNYLAILGVTTMTTVMSCSSAKKEYASYELYPVRSGNLVEMEYAPGATRFTLWAPTADEVRLCFMMQGKVVMLTKRRKWNLLKTEHGR